MEKGGAIYILANKNHSVFYTGVTSNLYQRVIDHKSKFYKGFTSKYNVDKLVYYELFTTIEEAIAREKQIKAGARKKKIALIESFNPNWDDLFDTIKHW